MKKKEVSLPDKVSQIVNGIVFDEDFENEITSEGMMNYLQNTYSLSESETKEIRELVFRIKRIVEH